MAIVAPRNMTRRKRQRVEIQRRQTVSKIQLEFLRRYFEAVLDTLLAAYPALGAWCAPGASEFQQYLRARNRSKNVPLPSGLLAGDLTGQFGDEACWHVAKYLSDLYQTQPFGDGKRVLVEIPEHRYSIMLAASKGPSPNATATLASRTWDSVLQEVGHTIWVDFLLWCVKRLPESVTARKMLMDSSEALRARLNDSRQLSTEEWARTWERNARSAMSTLADELPLMLNKNLISLTLQDLERLTAGFLRGFTHGFVRELADARWVLNQTLEEGLGTSLEAQEAQVTARHVDGYLREASSRRSLEDRASKEVHTRLQSGQYEVVLLLEGTLPRELTTSPGYGLTLTPVPPAIPRFAGRDGLIYARFSNVEGSSAEAVIHECRRRVQTTLAAVATWGRTPVDIRLLGEVHFRKDGWQTWAFSGVGGVFPIARAVGEWEKAFEAWRNLLEAEDELALRIHQAIIHFNRAECAYEAEERFEEYWKILESIGGEGVSAAVSWLYRLPLQFVPGSFRRMQRLNQEVFVKGRLRTLFWEFKAITNVRNKAVAHRPIAKADTVVLERWATAVAPRAREVLRAAISGWYQGARKPKDVLDRIEKAYASRFKFPLPSQGRF